MLDARFIRENLELVESRLGSRGTGVDLGGFRQLDTRRRELMQQSESLKALRNKVSDEISKVKDKKITVFKYKRRKDYKVKKGHRQPFTELLVEKIVVEA